MTSEVEEWKGVVVVVVVKSERACGRVGWGRDGGGGRGGVGVGMEGRVNKKTNHSL